MIPSEIDIWIKEDQTGWVEPAAQDPDGDRVTLVIVGQPHHGHVTVIGDRIRYRPDIQWAGQDSFTWYATDGTASSPVGTVNVTVIPHPRDTDHDGIPDKAEKAGPSARYPRCHTDPTRRDTDRDGLSDLAEVRRWHTDPCSWDTDHGGISDGVEVKAGSDPLDPSSGPNDPRKVVR